MDRVRLLGYGSSRYYYLCKSFCKSYPHHHLRDSICSLQKFNGTMASAAALRVCVYGSSSQETPEAFLKESERLGELLARGGHTCINGAGKFGCMGALNQGCAKTGGRIEGVIHKMWIPGGDKKDELQEDGITELHVVDGPTLTERKHMLNKDADCFIVLPGGPGTVRSSNVELGADGFVCAAGRDSRGDLTAPAGSPKGADPEACGAG